MSTYCAMSILLIFYLYLRILMSKRSRRDSDADYITGHEVDQEPEIRCTIPPCHVNPICFRDYLTYEAHIMSTHNHICAECHKRFPSESFLYIHIDENHNPFFQISKERGEKVYKCFQYSVAGGCKKVCIDRRKRRLHMIDKHGYPRDFNFGVIDSGIDSRNNSLLK